jgi:hypothetical protein
MIKKYCFYVNLSDSPETVSLVDIHLKIGIGNLLVAKKNVEAISGRSRFSYD